MVRSALYFAVLFLVMIFFLTGSVSAAVSGCSAGVSSVSVTPSYTDNFSFNISNAGDSTTANWIKITRPSGNFTINSHSIPDRTVSLNSNDVTVTGGDLPAGFTTVLIINVTAGSTEAASANWTVQLSDDGGSTTTDCTGTLGTAISSTVADTTAPTISDIVLSDLSDTSLKITWTTDENATTTVEYGKTDSYGSTATGNSNVTSHSVTIDSLSSNTTYHYIVKSSDSSGNAAASGDYTFTTAKAGTNTTTTTTVTSTTTKTVTVIKTVKDDTPPTISLDTDFDKSFTQPPKIIGRAKDNGDVNPGISRVEYSIDDGKTWMEVDRITSPNAKSTAFDFIPAIFEDGNFQIKVRAHDNSGNITASRSSTLIIDRLPPTVGGVLFSIGPQVISPTLDGLIVVLAGLEEKITLSAIGGPTGIDILTTRSVILNASEGSLANASSSDKLRDSSPARPDQNDNEGGKVFSLTKNLDNGLWSGMLSFSEPGVYQLIAKSVDGANNKTEKKLNTVVVLGSGIIKDQNGKAINGAKVFLYYYEPGLNQFILWDGKSFSQTNPQKTDSEGKYQLIVPAGKYYLQISASGYNSLKTNIFTVDKTMPISTQFDLSPFQGIQIGPFQIGWPGRYEPVIVKLPYPTLPEVSQTNLTGKEIPFFSFKNEGKEVTSNNFKGKATVLTFLSLWSPTTFEQLSILNNLQDSKEINSVAIMSQDTDSRVNIFKKIGGYKTPIAADADGVLIEPLGILNLPTHVFLDRKGIIRKTRVGVLTREELLENLIN